MLSSTSPHRKTTPLSEGQAERGEGRCSSSPSAKWWFGKDLLFPVVPGFGLFGFRTLHFAPIRYGRNKVQHGMKLVVGGISGQMSPTSGWNAIDKIRRFAFVKVFRRSYM